MDATEAAAIRADVVALREDLQHLTRRLLARQDRDDLAAMLPAVHSLLGVATWTVQALNACASPASPLRDLLKAYASEPGGLRAFGHFLARTEGIACRGHRLRRIGEDRDGALYLVERVRVSTPAKPAPALASSGEAVDHLPVRILRSQP